MERSDQSNSNYGARIIGKVKLNKETKIKLSGQCATASRMICDKSPEDIIESIRKPSWEAVDFGERIDASLVKVISRSALRVMLIASREKKEGKVCRLSYIYPEVICDRLAYRKISAHIFCSIDPDGKRTNRVKEIVEDCRFVFYRDMIYEEKANKTVCPINISRLKEELGNDICTYISESLPILYSFGDFDRYVDIVKKDRIQMAMRHGGSAVSPLSFSNFLQIYERCTRPPYLMGSIPEVVKADLSTDHDNPDEIQISDGISVITGQKQQRDITFDIELRMYITTERVFYFEKDPFSGIWGPGCEDDFLSCLGFRGRMIDRKLIARTCFKHLTEHLVVSTGEDSLDIGMLIMGRAYLSVEQASKTNAELFNALKDNILEGYSISKKKNLPQVMGVSGGQLKFFDKSNIPSDISSFGKLMTAEDFIKGFPDVKKRIYAVAFFMYEKGGGKQVIDRSLVIRAAPTLNSLAVVEPARRSALEEVYRDYIIMYERYESVMSRFGSEENKRYLSYGDIRLNMKPSKIYENHRTICKVVGYITERGRVVRYNEKIRVLKKRDCSVIEYTGEKYSIVMPDDAEDILREGSQLCHCVGKAGYIEAMARGCTRILFLRKNSDLKKPFITIEEKNRAIVQCFGKHDSLNRDPEVRDFITEYSNKRHIKIMTTIYKG